MAGGGGIAEQDESAVFGGGGTAEQETSFVAGGGGIDEDEARTVFGGGGIAEQEASFVAGGGGIAEQEVSEVRGGGGIAEQVTAVLGGGGIFDLERVGFCPSATPLAPDSIRLIVRRLLVTPQAPFSGCAPTPHPQAAPGAWPRLFS